MKYYLISYDLKAPGQNYTQLYEEIKSLGDWRHPMESTWVVHTGNELSAKTIRERLQRNMDERDLILVVNISESDYSGWLATSFWDWYKKA